MVLQKILLRQHVGAPTEPIVKVGDRVKKGTLISKPTGLGANIFSSVYGTVKEITEDCKIGLTVKEPTSGVVKVIYLNLDKTAVASVNVTGNLLF